jgi:hypothetical protein
MSSSGANQSNSVSGSSAAAITGHNFPNALGANSINLTNQQNSQYEYSIDGKVTSAQANSVAGTASMNHHSTNATTN